MNQYNPKLGIDRRVGQVERDITKLAAQLEQDRRNRFAQQNDLQNIRWAITTDSGYPTADANTFPIRFLDASFTNAAGNQTFSAAVRQNDAATQAHAQTGQFIPPNVPLPVFWKRGLSAAGAGEWWFLDPPLFYFGKLAAELSPISSALMDLWLFNDSFVPTRTDPLVQLTVRDVLLVTDPLPLYTRVIIGRHFQPFAAWVVIAAACEPDADDSTWGPGE